MKRKNMIFEVLTILTNITMITGIHTVFSPCSNPDKVMKCNYSARVILILFVIQLIISVMKIFIKGLNETGTKCLTVLSIFLYVVKILVGRVLIGGCTDANMRCNSVMFPAVYIGIIVGLILQILIYIALSKGKNNA